MKLVTSHRAVPVLLSLALCFFTGCASNSERTSTTETVNTNPPASGVAGAGAPPEPIEPPVTTPATPPATPPATSNSGGLADRAVDDKRLSIVIDNIAQGLEAQQLAYLSDKGQDCSGIYHKIKDQIQQNITVLGDQARYTYPTYKGDRNTRQIAYWYHKNGNLHLVQDALADRNLIRPGSVMFYGRTEEKYSNITIETLSNPGVFEHDKASGRGKIYHVATVTKVEKDNDGNVVRYTIMHGRNSRNPASRTSGNYDGPGGYGKAFAKFPFGNWNQQWVAVAILRRRCVSHSSGFT